jgi:hypothetical protein
MSAHRVASAPVGNALVEVAVSRGLPSFTMVGYPDGRARDLRDSVRSRLDRDHGQEMPGLRITVNISPARLRLALPWDDLASTIAALIAGDPAYTGREHGPFWPTLHDLAAATETADALACFGESVDAANLLIPTARGYLRGLALEASR